MDNKNFQTVGECYKNFQIKRHSEISEIQSQVIELEHLPTGAEILCIVNDDDENVFNLSFRTWPDTSNGVAHILEHTVLCGSEHFPVKDPFFGMNRRSLNTFMNALTGSDFTCYPAATQVPKDFYNLLEVYLDAVFHPKLARLSFLQEGHRLEFEEPTNSNTPLEHKGIVFNEMKGALATVEARLSEKLMEVLFPHLPYGVNSGGDPAEIPRLTYEELKEFHKKFYHPSRCLFYFYGNLPLIKHLDFLEERAFKGVTKMPPLPLLTPEKRYTSKLFKEGLYPVAEDEEGLEEKTVVGMSWLTCSILEQHEVLALHVLEMLLMGTDASPLKMALLKSGLCKQTDSMLDSEISEVPFILVCKGCPGNKVKELETFVFTILSQIKKEGFPPELIEGAIHQLEIARTEITGSSTPYGLSLFFRSGLLKQHGGNPEDGLKIHTLFQKLRTNLSNPNYLPFLIDKHFLSNSHFVHVAMHPDKKIMSQEVAKEKQELEEIAKKLSVDEKKKLIQQARELAKYQEENEEGYDILPKVTLQDVSPQEKEFCLKNDQSFPFNLLYHPCFTNDLIYADMIYDLPKIDEEDLPYLRLFSLFLPQIGCGGRNYQEHLDHLLKHTGGVGVSLDLCTQADDSNQMKPALSIRGKALYRKRDKFFPILHDIIASADFTDKERIQELLMQHYQSVETSIHQSSLRYAVNLAASGLNFPSKITNAWYGLDYFWNLKEIFSTFEKNPFYLIDKMKKLQAMCLGLQGADLVLSCSESHLEELKKEDFYGLSHLSTKTFEPWRNHFSLNAIQSQCRVTASPVAFTAFLFPSVNYRHKDAAHISLAAQIIENTILHTKIREQGGAYGSGAVHNLVSGYFYLFAYRDPHLEQTISTFREAISQLAEGAFDEQELEEAKLSLFQDLDAPVPPGSRAITAYLRLRGGRPPKIRQEFRKQLFNANKKGLTEAARTYLASAFEKGVMVTFAGKEFFDKEQEFIKKENLPLHPIEKT